MRRIAAAVLAAACNAGAHRPAQDVWVEYLQSDEAVGLSEPQPVFRWSLPSGDRGLSLAAYRVVVAEALNASAVRWDSGKVSSNHTSAEYAGAALESETPYTVSVEWWGGDGVKAPPATASFDVGLLTEADWGTAEWVGGAGARCIHVTFDAPSDDRIVWARAYVAAPGCAVVRLNGRPVGRGNSTGICPWTQFSKTVLYETVPLHSLAPGRNAIGLLLGNTMWGSAKGAAQSETALRFKLSGITASGKRITVTSAAGQDWLAARGPLLSDDPWLGTETNWTAYSALLAAGWSTTSFDATKTGQSWSPVARFTAVSLPTPRALAIPQTRVVRRLRPTSVKRLAGGDLLFSFPENFVGQIEIDASRVHVAGPGSLSLVHSEVATAEGVNASWAWANVDKHVFSASGAAGITSLRPVFTWHGFQHVQVSEQGGVSLDESVDALWGLNTVTPLTSTGAITFSGGDGPMLGRLQGLILRGQQSNVAQYMPTDCPTREKHGWLGDAQVTAEEAMYNFQMGPVYTEFLNTIRDDQLTADKKEELGDVPGVVPNVGLSADGRGPRHDISWTAAYPLIAGWMWKYYEDSRIVRGHWDSLRLYVDGTLNSSGGALPTYWTWGDWCAVEARATATPNTGPELAAFNFILSVDTMAQLAGEVMSNGTLQQHYSSVARQLRASFHKEFYNESTGAYGSDAASLQTLTVAPLAADVMPDEATRVRAVAALNADIAKRGFHQTVGSAGQKHLLPQLTRAGSHDVAMKIATQTTEPSYGYWLSLGATTCWEDYSGLPDPTHPPVPTHNHIFLCGGLGEWLYRSVVGVAPLSAGYGQISVAPRVLPPGSGPDGVNGTLHTVRGVVQVAWTRPAEGEIALATTLPPGTSGRVAVPVKSAASTVSEGGAAVWGPDGFVPGTAGILGAEWDSGTSSVVFAVQSGGYSFSAS